MNLKVQPFAAASSAPASERRRLDPWRSWARAQTSLMLRAVVNRRGMMSARRYLRAERLLRRWLSVRERELKQHTLQTVLDAWVTSGACGSLESTVRDVAQRLSEGDERSLAEIVNGSAQSARQSIPDSGLQRAAAAQERLARAR